MKHTNWRPDSSAHRRPRGAATVAAAAAVFSLVASCSSTGGKPQESGGGMGGGTADTPRMTIAMITELGTLQSYVAALGGHLRIVAEFSDSSVELTA
jgi:hypothetical protein